MFFDPNLQVRDCSDLSVGEQIQVWQGDRMYETGTVTDLFPAMGLFWIRERVLGERRLLQMSDFQIIRISNPASYDPTPPAH